MSKLALLSALALIASTPAAQAASVINSDGKGVTLDQSGTFSWTVDFAGASGAAGKVTFNLLSADAAGTTWNFSYSLDNTSLSPSLSSRIGVFGFDTSDTLASTTTGSGNRFTAGAGGNFNGQGNRDVCLYAGQNCNGAGNSGVTVSESPIAGTFSLNFASAQQSLVLDRFATRWQAAGQNATLSLSAPGTITSPVPEPATWAMMLLGFGTIGHALRRRTAVRFGQA